MKADHPRANAHTYIYNDLLPQNDQPREDGDRRSKLASLLETADWSHLTEEQQMQLFQIITKHYPLFILEKGELGTIRLPPALLTISDPSSVKGPIYRYPERAKEIIAELLSDMEARDIIEPSTAAWPSPIVLVTKPDGSKRMWLDYRKVNQHLATDIYLLPRLEELLETAAGHKYYATLELKDAYFQVMLEEGSRDVTSFSDGVSLYWFKRLPFGLSCSPAIFSRQIS